MGLGGRTAQFGTSKDGKVHGCFSSQSFWKRTSFRSGSNMGSSRSSAGVSGTFGAVGPRMVSKAVFLRRRPPGRARPSARPRARGSRSEWDQLSRPSRSDSRRWPFQHSQRGGLVTQTHIGQSEIANEAIIVRLFFEERFQFAARLSPTFLSGGMVAGNFLRPT